MANFNTETVVSSGIVGADADEKLKDFAVELANLCQKYQFHLSISISDNLGIFQYDEDEPHVRRIEDCRAW